MSRNYLVRAVLLTAVAAVAATVAPATVARAQSPSTICEIGASPTYFVRVEAVNASGVRSGSAADSRCPGASLVLTAEFRYVAHSWFLPPGSTVAFAYSGTNADGNPEIFLYEVVQAATPGPWVVDVLSAAQNNSGSSNTGSGQLQTIGGIFDANISVVVN